MQWVAGALRGAPHACASCGLGAPQKIRATGRPRPPAAAPAPRRPAQRAVRLVLMLFTLRDAVRVHPGSTHAVRVSTVETPTGWRQTFASASTCMPRAKCLVAQHPQQFGMAGSCIQARSCGAPVPAALSHVRRPGSCPPPGVTRPASLPPLPLPLHPARSHLTPTPHPHPGPSAGIQRPRARGGACCHAAGGGVTRQCRVVRGIGGPPRKVTGPQSCNPARLRRLCGSQGRPLNICCRGRHPRAPAHAGAAAASPQSSGLAG